MYVAIAMWTFGSAVFDSANQSENQTSVISGPPARDFRSVHLVSSL